MDPASRRLIVELEPGEPIAGWIEGDGAPRRRFVGLLELIAALDSAHALTDDRPEGDETD